MTPAAVIPMHTPEEAIEELEHVRKRGLKVVMMASMVRRPIPAAANAPSAPRFATWLDMLGLDSEYDYDPVWAKCVELGISPTFHSGSRGLGLRVSPTNFVYNHIGHFAAASEAVCKAIFLGGVTRRFPTLKMAFLEGGVGWACGLEERHLERDRKSTRLNSSHQIISYAVFCLKKKKYVQTRCSSYAMRQLTWFTSMT